MTKPKRTLAATAALLLVLGVAGCGRSDHEVLTEYCRGLAYCGIYNWTANDVDACIEGYEHPPTGTPREQCLAREIAVCVGNCFHDKGCTVFEQNDPCSCEHKDYGCPE